jgi:hypothetical protein
MQEIESTCAIGANDVQFSNICVSQADGRACNMLVDARLGSPDVSHAAQNGLQCLRWKRSKQKIYREIPSMAGLVLG